MAALIIRRMDDEFVALRGREAAAESFARAVHDSWGVGDAERQDGVLVFVSVEEGLVYVAAGEGIRDVLEGRRMKIGIMHAKRCLGQRAYFAAMEYVIKAVYRSVTPSVLSPHTQLSIMFLVFITVLSFLPNHHHYEGEAMLEGLHLLRKFEQEVSRLVRVVFNQDALFSSSACPVCQEVFTPTTELSEEYDGSFSIHRVPLPCGHMLCYRCMSSYKRKNKLRCPSCKMDFSALFNTRVFAVEEGNPGVEFAVLLESVHYMHHMCPYVISLFDRSTMGDCIIHGDLKRLLRYTRYRLRETEQHFTNFTYVICFRNALVNYCMALICIQVMDIMI